MCQTFKFSADLIDELEALVVARDSGSEEIEEKAI
jgi:hypothetical protein